MGTINRLKRALPILKDPFVRFYLKSNAKLLLDRNRSDGYASMPPIHISVLPTRACNLRCRMCQQWGEKGYLHKKKYAEDVKNTLPLETWKKILDDIAAFRPSIDFFGGEPLIYPHIDKLFEYTAKLDIPWIITTNATLLERHATSIVENNCWLVWISIDGLPDTHNRVRGSKTAFDRTAKGLKTLINERNKRGKSLPFVLINFTFTQENHTELVEFADLARELEPDVLRYSISWIQTKRMGEKYERILREEFDTEADCWQPYQWDKVNMDLERLQSDLNYALKRPDPFIKNMFPNPKVVDMVNFYSKPEYNFGYDRCYQPYFQADILADGSVTYCHDFTELTFGNVLDDPFMKIWNNEKSRKFRKYLKTNDLGVCSRCCGLYAHPINRNL